MAATSSPSNTEPWRPQPVSDTRGAEKKTKLEVKEVKGQQGHLGTVLLEEF